MDMWQLFFGLGGLALGAWGTITLIYALAWRVPFHLALAWGARWIGALGIMVALAAVLITEAGVAPVPALAIALIVTVPTGLALRLLPANVLAR